MEETVGGEADTQTMAPKFASWNRLGRGAERFLAVNSKCKNLQEEEADGTGVCRPPAHPLKARFPLSPPAKQR